jgi:hypothetical protein
VIRNPRKLKSMGQRNWAVCWETTQERLEDGESTVFMRPPDAMYVVKFHQVWSSADSLERIFNHTSGKSNAMVICRKQVMDVPANRIPRAIMAQVDKPIFGGPPDKVTFEVRNLAGNLIGFYDFKAGNKVTASMLRNVVEPDIDNFNPRTMKVFFISSYMPINIINQICESHLD